MCVDDRSATIEPVRRGKCFERVRTNMLGCFAVPQVSTFVVSVDVGKVSNGSHVFRNRNGFIFASVDFSPMYIAIPLVVIAAIAKQRA